MTSNVSNLQDQPALIGTWALDPALTKVTISTKALWVLPVIGTFSAIEGQAIVTSEGDVTGRIVLDAASIATGNDKRDRHLRTADFLDTNTYPTLGFTADRARLTDAADHILIDGAFTAHGVERPLTVPAQIAIQGTDITVTARLDLDRGDWGVVNTAKGASRRTHVTVVATFVRRGTGTPA